LGFNASPNLIYDDVRLPRDCRANIGGGETVILGDRVNRTYPAGSRGTASGRSAAEQLRGGIAAKPQHHPVERWDPLFRQWAGMVSSEVRHSVTTSV
jgi:hypothetical protein